MRDIRNELVEMLRNEVKPAVGCTCLLYTSPSPRD